MEKDKGIDIKVMADTTRKFYQQVVLVSNTEDIDGKKRICLKMGEGMVELGQSLIDYGDQQED